MTGTKAAALAALAALLLACGSGEGDVRGEAAGESGPGTGATGAAPAGRPGAALDGELLVSAAASLTDAFRELASAFEAAHPGVEVTLNLASSSSLRAQILEGAPADVFASASAWHVERLVEGGEVAGEPRVFARNRLRIAVPPGNPGGVGGLADFAREELLLGLCAASAPCGDFARRALAEAGVTPAIDTEEPDVRALLTKVELGELDAGIVYVTDVLAAGDAVEGVEIPEGRDVAGDYPIAVLAGAPNPEAARAFVDFVLSPEGRAALARHGFEAPRP